MTTLYVAGMEIEYVDEVESQRTVYYGAGGAFRIIGGDRAGLYFRHTDHLGSTSVLSDANGLRVEGSAVVYAPFGEIRVGEQSALTDFGFTGQRLDSSTGGLMYYGARYYLPSLRRFISADTIVPSTVNPQALNRYSYAYSNPLKYKDPSGHIPMIDGAYTVESALRKVARERTQEIQQNIPALARGEPASYPEGHDTIAHLQNQLRDQGITAEFEGDISAGEQISTLARVNRTVGVIDRATQEFGGFQGLLSDHSSTTAVGEPVHILIQRGAYVGDGIFGRNSGFLGGSWHIQLAIDPLLGRVGRPGNNSNNLIAHELCHMLTWKGYNYIQYATGEGPFGETAWGDRVARDYTDLGIIAGDYAYRRDEYRYYNHPANVTLRAAGVPDEETYFNPNWQVELTTDYLASTFMNNFNNDGANISQDVYDYLRSR